MGHACQSTSEQLIRTLSMRFRLIRNIVVGNINRQTFISQNSMANLVGACFGSLHSNTGKVRDTESSARSAHLNPDLACRELSPRSAFPIADGVLECRSRSGEVTNRVADDFSFHGPHLETFHERKRKGVS
jgi:hypothetical protein